MIRIPANAATADFTPTVLQRLASRGVTLLEKVEGADGKAAYEVATRGVCLVWTRLQVLRAAWRVRS